jgi:BirA family biotin operon repressor/biotin-[acetyl-CoA-carboxylase] ligase
MALPGGGRQTVFPCGIPCGLRPSLVRYPTRPSLPRPPSLPRCAVIDERLLREVGYATIVHRGHLETTMTEARGLAADPAAALPAVVVADRQLHGQGQRGAGWWQAPGSLAASLVVERTVAAETSGPQPLWSLACGVALAESLATFLPGHAVTLRWPNDVEVAGRKLAGILVEGTTSGRTIFGIGVNTAGRAADAPAALRRRLVTIPDLVGVPLDRGLLLAALLPRLCDLLAEPAAVAVRYRTRCSLVGTEVVLYAAGAEHAGICRGIDRDGALVIDTPAGPRRFLSGSLTPPAAIWQPESEHHIVGVSDTDNVR